jgi:prepilin-type N-terminal cleavage/methylation domain-containing protein
MRSARGFTLTELLVVMVLLGLIAGAATLRLAPLLDTATLEDACGRLEELDRLTRYRARSDWRECRLVLDLDRQVAFRLEDGSDVPRARRRLGRCRVAQIRRAEGTVTAGTVEMRVSSIGACPTYAVQVQGGGDRTRWLVFAGLSGECEVFDDEEPVDRAFAALALRLALRADAR